MLTYPQRFVGLDATLSALFGRPVRVNLHEVRAFTLAVVFGQIGERVPR